MQAFFREEFCILLLPAHPGAPSRGVLIGGAGAAPADGLASHLREPRGSCPALQRGPAIGGSSPPDECRRKPAGSGGRKVGPVVVGAVPAAKIAAVERREASVSRGRLRRLRKLVYGARRAPRLASVELLMRLSALRSLGFEGSDDRRTRRLTKTRADDAWLFDTVGAQNIPPHPEERRSRVSKDGQRARACMVRDASLRDAPHHEGRGRRRDARLFEN